MHIHDTQWQLSLASFWSSRTPCPILGIVDNRSPPHKSDTCWKARSSVAAARARRRAKRRPALSRAQGARIRSSASQNWSRSSPTRGRRVPVGLRRAPSSDDRVRVGPNLAPSRTHTHVNRPTRGEVAPPELASFLHPEFDFQRGRSQFGAGGPDSGGRLGRAASEHAPLARGGPSLGEPPPLLWTVRPVCPPLGPGCSPGLILVKVDHFGH